MPAPEQLKGRKKVSSRKYQKSGYHHKMWTGDLVQYLFIGHCRSKDGFYCTIERAASTPKGPFFIVLRPHGWSRGEPRVESGPITTLLQAKALYEMQMNLLGKEKGK